MNALGRPAVQYRPEDKPPKTARYQLTDPRTGLCRYYHTKIRLLAAAKKLVAQGITPKAESIATRPPGRPTGSLQKHTLREPLRYLEQQYTAKERAAISAAAQTLRLSVVDFIRQTALARAGYILDEEQKTP